MTLVELQSEFRHARRRADRTAKFRPADEKGNRCPPLTCRYCGRFWKQWHSSQLDGHAACIVDERFKHMVKLVLVDPRRTYQDIALAIGVSASVVRSWTFPVKATPFSRPKK